MNGVLRADERTSGSLRPFGIGVAVVASALAVLQLVASCSGFPGPMPSIWNDFFGTPKSMAVPWGGLALAMVGVGTSVRIWALSAAVAIDLIGVAIRLDAGLPFAVGNGAVIVLASLAVYTASRRDIRGLKAACFGGLLILATKAGDAWLQITTIVRPYVLDEYAQLADHALGNPSWIVGSALAQLGPGVYAVLHWVYIQLPVAAIAIAIYQLRGLTRGEAWPSHYLVRTFLLIGLVGPIFYVLFPVVGPVFAFGPDGDGFQLGNYWPSLVPFDATPSAIGFDGETPRNCMPSLHTAWALALFVHSRRGPWWLRAGGTTWLVCTLAATLGFGYHYGVDLVAGVVLCLTLESTLRDPERGWDRARIRLVAFGSTIMVALLLSYRYLAVQFGTFPELFGPLTLVLMGAVVGMFYATFFATPGTALATWGGQASPVRPTPSR
ncbi:phosphatase PAP2 family protein [Rhodococcoides kyotonense]|uniref:PAP2 superfamily protein n=1 Tax=Rhodococcoides kyotonense TaxID=398843 RepID=A0A239G804_9NOCA|nr:phosphatase PAP2 family protein [Rhodococcus kyotonensis]SNS64593.1 PAP2 superfamily protein [Rhodococcus kyotonensis]